MSSGGVERLADDGAVIDLGSRVSSVRIGPGGTVLAGTAAGVVCLRLNPKHWFG